MTSRPLLAWIAGLGIGATGALALTSAGVAVPGLPAGALAQNDQTFSGVRALNLARNHAVKLNGGLSTYRPAGCMFSTEWSGSECLVHRDAAGCLFRFLGGPPGWQQLHLPPTIETEILIGPDGRAVVQVLYNGPPRQPPSTGSAPASTPAGS